MIGRHALDRQRDVVVARALAIARTRDRKQTNMMRLAVLIDARRKNAERLPFKDRERRRREVEDDMPDVGRRAIRGQPIVARDGGDRGLRLRIEVDIRMRCGPGRRGRPALARCSNLGQLAYIIGDFDLRTSLQLDGRR